MPDLGIRADFRWFLAASVINGAWQVTQNSWDCLLVDAVDWSQIPRVYSLIKIPADFSARPRRSPPCSSPTSVLDSPVRILYLNAFVIMSLKIWLLYRFSPRRPRPGGSVWEQTRGISIGDRCVGVPLRCSA